jgi:hypothetical protein
MTTLQKALVAATVVVLAGVGIFEGVRAARAGAEVDRFRRQQARLEQQVKLLETARDGAAGQAALGRADDQEQRRRLEHLELLSLRGRVGQLAGELRQQLSLAAAQAATNQDTPTNQDTALLSSSATNRVANGNTLVLGGWAVNGGRSYLLITPVIQSNDGASPAGYPFTIQSQIVSAPERFWNQIGWLDAQSGAHCSTVTMTLDADDTAMLLKAIETTPGAGASNASSSQCLDGNSVGVGWTMTDGAGVGALMSVEVVPRMAANGQSIEMEITPGSAKSTTPVHSWLRP